MSEPGIKLGKTLQKILKAKPGTDLSIRVTMDLQSDIKRAFGFAETLKPVQVIEKKESGA